MAVLFMSAEALAVVGNDDDGGVSLDLLVCCNVDKMLPAAASAALMAES